VNYDTPNSKHRPPRPNTPRCREGMISHFQGWKREYYHFTTRPPSLNAHLLLTSKEGFIPLVLNYDSFSVPTIGASLNIHYGILPLVPGGDASLIVPPQRSAATEKVAGSSAVFSGSERKGLYCQKFKSDLKTCLSFIPESHITFARRNVLKGRRTPITEPAWNMDGDSSISSGVTLLVVGSVEDALSGALEASLLEWTGSSVSCQPT
jgi:hypothetical protein